MTVELTIMSGEMKGKSYSFEERTICWVGRNDDCKISFSSSSDYASISRIHCVFDIDPPKIYVRDCKSKHGTYVESQLIGKRVDNVKKDERENAPIQKNLYSGDIITLGNVDIIVKITGEQPDYSPAATPATPGFWAKAASLALCWLKNWLEISHGNSDNPASAKLANDTIDGYRITKELGSGGYGKVFLAENKRGDKFAIKILKPEVRATPSKVKQFEREIDNAKALNHPNVVRLLDRSFDVENNCLYYAMEYCQGDNLSTFVNAMGGIVPLPQAKDIFFQVLDGLEYTHSAEIPEVKLRNGGYGKGKGLVHRDLKPSNIMLAKSTLGYVAKIGDFGLSKAFDLAGLTGNTLTGDGEFRGTPQFMCRKQFFDYHLAGREVDIWAAAACLYYMLTSQYPRNMHAQDTWEVLSERQVIPIRQRNPDIPAALAEVIDRALKEDGDRQPLFYQDVRTFKRDLQRAFQHLGI